MLLALLLILAGLAGAIAPQTAAAKSKITFTPNTLYVPAEGGVYEVKIRCKESFWINDITTPSWIQLFTSYGLPKGSDTWFTLPFFFRPNTEGSRKGVITFKTSKGEVKSQMIQLGGAKPGSDKAIFTLSPEELDMSAYADRKIVTLSCNLAYRFVDKIDKPNWLEVEEERWSYDLEKSIPIISKTNAGGKREGVITFKTSEGDVKLKVTQEGGADPKSFITLVPKELKVDAEGGAHKVTLSGKQGFDVSNLVIMPSWIRMGEKASGSTSYSYTLEFQPNTGPERTGDVVFTIGQGVIKLKVTQAEGKVPEFTLEPKELKVSAGGAWYKVYISCNQDFEIKEKETILPSWMNPFVQVAKINSHSYSCLFTTYVNTHGERSGEIVIKTTKGDVKLKVTQEAAAEPEPDEPVFTLDPKELKMEADGGEKEVTLSYPDYFDVKDVKLPSWISQSQFDYSTLYHGCTFKFKFAPNTGAERTADVVIQTDKGDVTLKVTQAAAGTKPEAKFTLEPKELKVETDGGKKEVTISSN